MDSLFPFGLPRPTASYATLYVLTFALHQALVHYVVAGSLFVAGDLILSGKKPGPTARRRPADVLRDWMPFMLSAAITAGVAPLLFVQILYQREFYTANLLLAWRWMVVIPVLIVAFYLLYLLKSPRLVGWPRAVQAAAAAAAGIAFVFVGFCWTANYWLSVSESSWADVYVSGDLPFGTIDVGLRMLVWLGGGLASMATILGWQLAGLHPTAADAVVDREVPDASRSLPAVALGGLVVAAAAGATFLWRADSPLREPLVGLAGGPYLAAAVVGASIQAWAWSATLWRRNLSRGILALATFGWLLAIGSVSVMRELVRLASLDLVRLSADHATAAEVGGLIVFLIFAVVNLAAIGGCILIVRRSSSASPPEQTAHLK